MKSTCILYGLTLAALAFPESRITMDRLPPAVQTAVKEQAKGAEILGFATERERGQVVYEAETKRDG